MHLSPQVPQSLRLVEGPIESELESATRTPSSATDEQKTKGFEGSARSANQQDPSTRLLSPSMFPPEPNRSTTCEVQREALPLAHCMRLLPTHGRGFGGTPPRFELGFAKSLMKSPFL